MANTIIMAEACKSKNLNLVRALVWIEISGGVMIGLLLDRPFPGPNPLG